MKNILKSFLTIASAVALFASCAQEAKPLASAVSLDKTEVSFEGLSAVAQTVTVKADGDWFAIAPEWVAIDPVTGSGDTEVSISVCDNIDSYNELSGPRSGVVSFCYGTTGIAVLSVNQRGETGLDASRQYTKITKSEEFGTGSYLIVFNYNGKDNALKAFNATSDTDYSYLYGDEVTVEDGVINTPNANNAYSFETAEGGYKIKMPNGRYLFQNASYNNFYSSDDVAKGDVWTVSFDEDGYAAIKNITTADKWMQWTSYGNAGAYSSAQDGAVLPMLYKDSKPASDEILTVPETVSVASNATTATIAVTSNKTWKVRCHDEWITDFTKEGEGNGEIELTFTANESKTDARTASIQVIGQTTNIVIKFVQNKVATTVAEITSQIISTDKNAQSPYAAELSEAGAVVSYVNGGNAYIEDKTGAILLYKSGHGLTAGQKVSGSVSGVGYLYSALPELTSLEGAETSEGGEIPCTEITLADLLDNYNANLSRRVLIKGVEVTDAIDGDDRDGKIEANGKSVAVRAQLKTLKMPVGKCDIICFPSLYNKNKQLAFWEDAHCTYTEIVTTLSASDASLKVGETAKVSYKTDNTEGKVTYSIDKTNIATVSADGTISAVSEGVATITVKVAAAGVYTAAETTAKVNIAAAAENPGDSKEIESIKMADCFSEAITFEVGKTYKMGSLTCSYDKQNGTSASNFNAKDPGVRFYAHDVMTFSAEKEFTKLEFVYYGGKKGPVTVETGAVEDTGTAIVWTGAAKSVAFDATSQVRFNEIKVTYK